MNAAASESRRTSLVLAGDTATDLMVPNPVSIRDTATLAEAVALLADRAIGAAPVVDEAGRPVGVVSQTDILIHEREQIGKPTVPSGPAPDVLVRDLMTPAIFAVPPDHPAYRVVEELLRLRVHQLFVVDAGGVLIGVISTHDVLRHLRPGFGG
jgi:CBS domain-containing protein